MRNEKVLVRMPGKTINRGLRIKDRGEVDVATAVRQHSDFCMALCEIGLDLAVWLPANDAFPDSVFVEDPAVIIEETLIIARLARAERQGEETEVESALRPYFEDIVHIEPPGLVEGGDVLVTDGHLYVGLSGRTNLAGAEQLARFARDKYRYHASLIELPDDHLHLKGEVTYHPDSKTIVVAERLAPEFRNDRHRLIDIPLKSDAERFGANCISRRTSFIVDARCGAARTILAGHGFSIRPVDLDQFDRVDGAMTCLSKIF